MLKKCGGARVWACFAGTKNIRILRHESSRRGSQKAATGPRRRRCGGVEEIGEASRRGRAASEDARQRKAFADPVLSRRPRRDDGRRTCRRSEAEPVGLVAASG